MIAPTFFPDAASFRAWLEANHDSAEELSVGFRKKVTGAPSITWPEARDEALCFGWIDGVRHRIDDRVTASASPRAAPAASGRWSMSSVSPR